MNLKKLLKEIKYMELKGENNDIDIAEITRDSREVAQNYLYIAIEGENIDGHDFIDDVIKNGARVIVHSKELNKYEDNICYIGVSDTRDAMAEISKVFFYVPGDMKILGVTGTNGKTTSTMMLKHVLETTGAKVGLIGTIANYIGDKVIPTERTTPESIELFRLLRDMKLEGCSYCVMEVSSHASVLNRIAGLEFEVGGFTNLTQDHLDFHKTFKEYYKAKFKFIEYANNHVINVDDKYGRDMIKDLELKDKYSYTYGIDNGMFRASNVELTASGSSFNLLIEGVNRGKFTIHIPGVYNVYNALGVIAMLNVCGIDVSTMRDGFETMKSVDGRCEKVYHEKLKSTVVVDYAHTPDGLDNILKTMREVVKGKLITVFGCGGNRDKTKRPLMGEVASKYSDFVVVTSDNPRFENPTDIIKDIMAGMSGEYIMLEDRRCAIEYAIQLAEQDDIVVIAGKGHEDYQIIRDEKVHFSDKEVVVEFFDKK